MHASNNTARLFVLPYYMTLSSFAFSNVPPTFASFLGVCLKMYLAVNRTPSVVHRTPSVDPRELNAGQPTEAFAEEQQRVGQLGWRILEDVADAVNLQEAGASLKGRK